MRLLESQAAPERRGGGTMTSMVVHAALIAGAVVASARPMPATRDVPIPDEIVYRAPVPEQPRQPTASTGGATGTTTTTAGTIPVPRTVVTGIPAVNLTVDVPLGTTPEVRLGGSGGGAEGGFGGPDGARGAPDGSGAWDAHTVEVPVVPDARNPVPSYPELLRSARITGRVVAEFIVDSTGRVRPGSLAVVEASHELFASSVRRTVPSFRFAPATVRGRRVAQRVRVPFEFEMQ